MPYLPRILWLALWKSWGRIPTVVNWFLISDFQWPKILHLALGWRHPALSVGPSIPLHTLPSESALWLQSLFFSHHYSPPSGLLIATLLVWKFGKKIRDSFLFLPSSFSIIFLSAPPTFISLSLSLLGRVWGEPDKWVNWINYEMSHPPIVVLGDCSSGWHPVAITHRHIMLIPTFFFHYSWKHLNSYDTYPIKSKTCHRFYEEKMIGM